MVYKSFGGSLPYSCTDQSIDHARHQTSDPGQRKGMSTKACSGTFLKLRKFSCPKLTFRWPLHLVVVQSLSHVLLFAIPWTVAYQASLSFAISQSLLKLMSIESVMPSNHLILCQPLFLLPSIFLSIRVFSNELAPCIRWPKYWSFNTITTC